MANPYDPGHPIVFWLAIILLAGGAYTGARAVLTSQDCEEQGMDHHWQWIPPQWECDSPGTLLD